jgi:hypothetical protein
MIALPNRLLLGFEARRRRIDLGLAIAGGAWIGIRDLNPWEALCVEGIVLTAVATLHAVRGPAEDRRAMPVGPAIIMTLLVAAALSTAAGAMAASMGSGGLALDGWWLSRCILLCWVLVVAAGGEAAGRWLGAGPAALALTGVPAVVALTAPLIGSPFFPAASSIALAISPLVSAGAVLGIDVAQTSPLYDLSSLGVMELQYPPPALHPSVAMVLSVGFLYRAARRRSRKCA